MLFQIEYVVPADVDRGEAVPGTFLGRGRANALDVAADLIEAGLWVTRITIV